MDILKEIEEGEQIGSISMMMAGNVASAILERDSRILLMREEIIRLNGLVNGTAAGQLLNDNTSLRAALAEASGNIVDMKAALEKIVYEYDHFYRMDRITTSFKMYEIAKEELEKLKGGVDEQIRPAAD